MDSQGTSFDVKNFLRWQVSRRDLFRSSAVAGAVIVGEGLTAACTDGGTPGGTTSSAANGSANAGSGGGVGGAPAGGGTNIVPTPRAETVIIDQGPYTVYDSFNPLIPNGEQYNGGVGQIAKEYLFYLNLATGKLVNWQGKSWSYNSAFTEVTLKLDPAVKWSDGKPFTSADVLFTVNLTKKNTDAITNGAWVSEVESVSVPDAQTVVFKLNQVDPRFHFNFVCQIISASLLVLPQHIWASQSITAFKNNPPIYTGPYKLQKTQPDLGLYIWEKNPDYWNNATMNPAAKYVVFRNAPPSDLENENFKNAEIDSPSGSAAYTYAKSLQGSGNKNVQITTFVDSDQRAIIVNSDPSRGALADPKFRYAISMLINRQQILNAVWPIPTVADVYPWPTYPNTKAWENPQIAAQFAANRAYNPTGAGQLLDGLGIKKTSGGKRQYDGKDLSLQIITPSQTSGTTAPEYIVGQLLSQELSNLGISTSLKALTSAVYQDRVDKGNYDLRSEWFGGALLDQYQLYEQFNSKIYYAPVGKNALSGDQMRLKEPAFDATIDRLSKLSPSAATSTATYNDALTQFYALQPVIPYLQTTYTHVFGTTYWTGWPTDANLYNVPSDWWGQFMFVIGALKPAGTK